MGEGNEMIAGMVQSSGAGDDMKTAKWLSVAPRCENNEHTSHLESFHTKRDKHDTTFLRQNNGYLYAEKNRPRPIWLPFQHNDYPIRMQEFDADDDWDITDIDRIKNETPMVVIQRYNGFFQGIRNNCLARISEDDDKLDEDKGQRSKDTCKSLYNQHSIDSTANYTLDDDPVAAAAEDDDDDDDDNDDQTEYNGETSRVQASKYEILTSTNFQRRFRTTFQPKQRLTKNAYDKWQQIYPMPIKSLDNFLLHQPASSVRETNANIQNKPTMESNEYLQALSEESETYDSDEFLSKIIIEFQKNFQLIPSKKNGNSFADRLRRFQEDLSDDVYSHRIESLDLNKNSDNATRKISRNSKGFPLKFLPNKQTGSDKAENMADKNVISGFDLTGDDFYRTFLPLSLAENEIVTKINPIAILDANEIKLPGPNEENSLEKNGFVYSLEDFPHPPDYFFDLDSDPFSSVSLLTDKQDIKETETYCGQLRTTERHICQTGGHLTFMLTNQTSEESIGSSSDGYLEFRHQDSRESDFISESVSTEFVFETNPNKKQFDLDCSESKNRKKCFVSPPPYVSLRTSTHDDISCTRRLTLNPDDGLESKNNESTELNPDIETRDTDTKDTDTKDADTKDTDTKDADTKDTDTKDTDTKDADTKDTERSCVRTRKTCCSITSKMEKPNVANASLSKNFSSHFQEGDERSKDRLAAIQNMLERAIAVDGVCCMTKNNFRQWNWSPIAKSVTARKT